jgi:hypothetical protein
MSTRRFAWVSLAMVGLLVLAACGDDDDDDDDTATTEAATDTSTGDATETTAAPDDGTAAGADSEYCQRVVELNEALNGSGEATVEMIDALEAAAPEEIAEEIGLIAPIFREAIEAGDIFAAFDDPVVQENLPAVSEYETEVCGISEDDGSDQDPSVTEVDPAAAQVAVEATDYAFAFEPPAAGRTSFTMTNAGAEGHLMVLVQLEEGASLDDALASEGEVGVAQEFESNFAEPGAEAVVTADLTPGAWVLLCPIPAEDGEAHYLKGMLTEFAIE